MFKAAIILFIFPIYVFSETIIFRNGSFKKGTIISQDKVSIALEEKAGSPPLIFSKKEILKISLNDLTKEEIKKSIIESGSGEVLKDVTPSVPVTPKNTDAGGPKGMFASKVPPTRWSAFWRSTLIPGWGQLYQNRSIPGTAYFFLFASSVGFAYYQSKEASNAQNDYNYSNQKYLFALLQGNQITQFTTRIDLINDGVDANKAAHRAEIAAGVLAGIYLVNLIDVVVFHPKTEFAIKASFQRDQLAFKFEYNF